jgi:hypothetical protein
MRKFRKKLKPELADIICDICGESCLSDCSMGDPAMAEWALLEALWGYCSGGKDGDKYRCEMCEKCFDKVRAFIDSMK